MTVKKKEKNRIRFEKSFDFFFRLLIETRSKKRVKKNKKFFMLVSLFVFIIEGEEGGEREVCEMRNGGARGERKVGIGYK